jgi:signal transduction histidine kinase
MPEALHGSKAAQPTGPTLFLGIDFNASLRNVAASRRQRSAAGILAFMLACAVSPATLADAPLPRSVLILNQSTSLRPWPAAIIAGIQSGMSDAGGAPISYYVEHLDLYRFDSPRYEDDLRAIFGEKYRDKPIGVIMAIGPSGLRVAIKLRAALWPKRSIVFAAVDDDAGTREIPSDVTGTTIRLTFANMMRAARIIVPTLKRFAIVGDRFEDQFYYRRFSEELPTVASGLEFIDLTGRPVSDVRRRVADLPDDSVIFYIGINSDPAVTISSAAEALPLITDVANRPIIVDVDTLFGSGAVGGFILSAAQIGRDAGRTALRILNGEHASDIPVTTGNALKPVFDGRQLRRWKVSEARLPPESDIRFVEPNIWDRYVVQILAAVAAVLLQGTLISWLLYERRRRHDAEAASRQTMSDLLHLNRLATAGELSASIAHEVNQPLAGIVSNANAGMRWLAAATPDIGRAEAAFRQIVAAGHHAGDVIASVRALFRRGNDERVQVEINEILRNAVSLERREIEDHGVSLALELGERLPHVLGNRVQLLQVMLNLIRNAIEAAAPDRPGTLRIRSRTDETGDILVSVEDSGTGISKQDVGRIFDPLFTTKPKGLGIGLSICRSIIEDHDGRLWVLSALGDGSTFFVKLPRYKAADGWHIAEKAP